MLDKIGAECVFNHFSSPNLAHYQTTQYKLTNKVLAICKNLDT